MKRVKLIAGISWAFIGLILIIILFPGLNGFSVSVSKLPFMKINPRYTGGEVLSHVISENCTLDVRKPVFTGLFKESNKGFVQIDWRGTVPQMINDTIDYDADGVKDFHISVNRKESITSFESFNSKSENITISTPTSYGWAVRVALIKGITSEYPQP
jgi:hypothetical protein